MTILKLATDSSYSCEGNILTLDYAYIWMIPSENGQGLIVHVFEREGEKPEYLEYEEILEKAFPEHAGKLIGFPIDHKRYLSFFAENEIIPKQPIIVDENGRGYLENLLNTVELSHCDWEIYEEWSEAEGDVLYPYLEAIALPKVEFGQQDITIGTPSAERNWLDHAPKNPEEAAKAFLNILIEINLKEAAKRR